MTQETPQTVNQQVNNTNPVTICPGAPKKRRRTTHTTANIDSPARRRLFN